MENILEKKHYRKAFFTLVAWILLGAFTLRLIVLCIIFKQELSLLSLVSSFLDNFIITLIITIIIGSFIFWITPENVFRSKMKVIDANEINPTLKSVLATTKFWIYKGTCGRYTRATTIPKLAEAARNSGFGRDITICLLDPKNHKICEEYAIYRRSLKSANPQKPWTKLSVQEEIIATIVTALKFRYLEPLLRINVYLVDHFSAFRLDISDEFVVVTKEDKTASALKADKDTYFYDSYKDDVRLTERQSNGLGFFPDLIFDQLIDDQKLLEVLNKSNIFKVDELSPESFQRIVNKINEPKDPY